jgi:hypothetical protein
MGSSEQQYKTPRVSPQLSASQMAEYLGATSTRRTKIIQEARFPKVTQVAYYDKCREGLGKFMADDARSYTHLSETLDYLQRRSARPDAGDWVKRDGRLSTEAIESFQLGYNKLGLAKLKCRLLHGNPVPLVYGRTKISVRPDVAVIRPNMGGNDAVGGIIFVFSRGESSTNKRQDRCKTLAGLIYQCAMARLQSLGDADPDLCLAVDVVERKVHGCPGKFTQKLRLIKESCEEIADRWLSVPQPADYDGPDYD